MPGPRILKYTVTSVFGDPDTVEGRRSGPHQGVDFATPSGTKLESLIDGTVIAAGNSPTLGRYITVRGAAGIFTYAHGGRIHARVGDKVRAGDIIFTSGNTGAGTGPHTHVEYKGVDGGHVDPVPVLRRLNIGGKPGGMAAPLLDDGGEHIQLEGEGDTPPGGTPPAGGGKEPKKLPEITGVESGGDAKYAEALRQIGMHSAFRRAGDTRVEARTKAVDSPSLAETFFTRPNTSASPQELLRGFSGYQGLDDLGAEEALPFLDNDFGGSSRAINNILRSLGYDPGYASPHTQFLQKTMSRMWKPVMATNALEGREVNQQDIAEQMVELLKQGRTNVDVQRLRQGIGNLPEESKDLSDPQRGLTTLLSNPAFAKSLYTDVSGWRGDYAGAASSAYDQAMEEFMNRNIGGGESYVDFIRKYLR